jgi:CubicO group peptidase (beta-lactamase class C family)
MHNADVTRFLANRARMDFTPGSRHAYSDTGYIVLAELIARVSGQSYNEFVEQKIFEPLGMKESFVTRAGVPDLPNVARSRIEAPSAVNCNTVVGDGGIYATAHDMALWNQYLEKSIVVGTTVAMDEAYKPASLSDSSTVPYGFGWRLGTLDGMTQYSHTGSWMGFATLNFRLPQKQFSVAVLSNDSNVDMRCNRREGHAGLDEIT